MYIYYIPLNLNTSKPKKRPISFAVGLGTYLHDFYFKRRSLADIMAPFLPLARPSLIKREFFLHSGDYTALKV